MATNGGTPQKRGHAEAFSYQSEGDYAMTPPHQRRKYTNEKRYSVEVQRVSIKKKKHTYEDSYSEKAPKGYHYLPVGYRRIKEFCREQCLKHDRIYYVVSLFPDPAKIKHDTNLITKNIYRHGWHFPLDVIFAAFAHFNLTRSDQVVNERNKLSNTTNTTDEAAMEEKLFDIFKDLFPAIPDSVVSEIIDHAFRKGTKRIGNASDVTVIRRVQLAVLAHIRHKYTDYEKLLKGGESRSLARYHIERKCLSRLLKWRGEDDEFELETRNEEVIIIDDDEDSEEETDEEAAALGYPTGAYHSRPGGDLEILGSRNLHTRENDFVQNLPAAYFNPGIATLLSQDYRGPYGQAMQPPKDKGIHHPGANRPLSTRPAGFSGPSYSRLSYNHSYPDLGRPIQSANTSPHFSNVMPSPAYAPHSDSRHVSVLAHSPAVIPSIVYDRNGQAYSFDPSSRIVTPLHSSPQPKIKLQPPLEMPSAWHGAGNMHSSQPGHGQAIPREVYSNSNGGPTQPTQTSPYPPTLPQNRPYSHPHGNENERSRFSGVPPTAHYYDLTGDEPQGRRMEYAGGGQQQKDMESQVHSGYSYPTYRY